MTTRSVNQVCSSRRPAGHALAVNHGVVLTSRSLLGRSPQCQEPAMSERRLSKSASRCERLKPTKRTRRTSLRSDSAHPADQWWSRAGQASTCPLLRAAVVSGSPDAYSAMLAVSRAFRHWAVDHPSECGLHPRPRVLRTPVLGRDRRRPPVRGDAAGPGPRRRRSRRLPAAAHLFPAGSRGAQVSCGGHSGWVAGDTEPRRVYPGPTRAADRRRAHARRSLSAGSTEGE